MFQILSSEYGSEKVIDSCIHFSDAFLFPMFHCYAIVFAADSIFDYDRNICMYLIVVVFFLQM